MTRAYEIIEKMMQDVSKEMDKLADSYARTSPTNIYDVSYRHTLEKLKDIQISKYNTLREVKMAFEDEIKRDFAEGFGKGVDNEDN